MNKPVVAISAAALLLGSASFALAQRTGSEPSPGQQMHENGSVQGHPGASGYAPDHDRDDLGKGTLRDRDDRGVMDRDRK